MMTRERQHAHNRNDTQRDHRAYAQCSPGRRRAGFTLVELMVTVALSIIILGMFAALYRWTTDTYSKQKGNRRNDQRSRMLSIIIRADLQLRSFRDVVAYVPGQDTTAAPAYDPNTKQGYNSTRRSGYFTISENNPDIQTDDVLQFTMRIPKDSKLRPFQGRSLVLFDPTAIDPHTGMPFPNNPTGWQHYMEDHPNQPEFDNGVENSAEGATASSVAEVSYFLRNGKLYRRVLLVREPYNDQGTGSAQPDALQHDYIRARSPRATGTDPIPFWRDFDDSAYYKPNTTGMQADWGIKLHSAGTSMINEGPNPVSSVDSDFGFPRSLGIPQLRFGQSLRMPDARPREFDTAGNFIGRFLTEETSHQQFGYPGTTTTGGDPHTRALTLNTATGKIGAYSTGTPVRRDEDVLMTNVHEFDVKVWDAAIGQFVDLGHTIAGGNYNRANNTRDPNLATAIGSGMTPGTNDYRWNRFDTWHPFDPTLPNPATATNASTPIGLAPYMPGSRVLGSSGERPLRAIQIRVRFYDVPTNKMRQITIVEYLGD